MIKKALLMASFLVFGIHAAHAKDQVSEQLPNCLVYTEAKQSDFGNGEHGFEIVFKDVPSMGKGGSIRASRDELKIISDKRIVDIQKGNSHLMGTIAKPHWSGFAKPTVFHAWYMGNMPGLRSCDFTKYLDIFWQKNEDDPALYNLVLRFACLDPHKK